LFKDQKTYVEVTMPNDKNEVLETSILSTEKKAENLQKAYHKPYLEELGDLRALTLGGSPTTVGDFSGSNWNTKPPTPPP
jgi:hypothetical protein